MVLNANFGNAEAGVTLAELIRDKEGIGALLSDGTRIASRTLDKERGTESYKWAMNVKGLECPGYDARSLKTFAIGWQLVRAAAATTVLQHMTLT